MLRALSLFSGYAPMCHGSDQQISIRNNQSDIELYVNEMLVGKGNAITSFKKKEDYIITAKKDGCNAVSIPTQKSFDAITLLGIFIDFGIIPILVIDGAATGVWNKFDQTSYIIDPQRPLNKSKHKNFIERDKIHAFLNPSLPGLINN